MPHLCNTRRTVRAIKTHTPQHVEITRKTSLVINHATAPLHTPERGDPIQDIVMTLVCRDIYCYYSGWLHKNAAVNTGGVVVQYNTL